MMTEPVVIPSFMLGVAMVLIFTAGMIIGALISYSEGKKALDKLQQLHLENLREIRDIYIEHAKKMKKGE